MLLKILMTRRRAGPIVKEKRFVVNLKILL